ARRRATTASTAGWSTDFSGVAEMLSRRFGWLARFVRHRRHRCNACALACKKRRKGTRQRHMPEHKSAHVGLVRNDALAANEQLFGKIARDQTQQPRRQTQQRRAMQ